MICCEALILYGTTITLVDIEVRVYMEYVYIVFAFIAVILLLLLTTKYLAYKSKKMLKGNYMHIVESLSLGVNNRLHLVRVDKEFFIISATNKSVEFLARANINDYEEEEIKNPISDVIDFKSVLIKYVKGFNFGSQAKAETESDSVLDYKYKDNTDSQAKDVIFKNNLEKLKHLNKSYRSENEQKK